MLCYVQTWGAIYTMDIYFQVQFKIGSDEIKRYRQYYLLFVFLATTIIASIPLGAGNFGYDYTTSLQTCIYLFGNNQAYFWLTLVLPFTVMLFTSFVFSILTFKRLHNIFVESQLRQNRKAKPGRVVSDVNSAQDDYADRMRFNYWSSDELDNDFDNDGRVIIKSTIPNPLNQGVELSNSTNAYDDESEDDEQYDESDERPTDVDFDMEDRRVLEELEEARRSVATSGPSVSINGGVTTPSRFSDADALDNRASSIGTRQTSAIIHTSVDRNQSASKMSNIWICLHKTWKYNGRMILFLFFFCACAIYILPTIIYLFYTKYDQFRHGTENFAGCLVRASLTSPIQSQEAVDARALALCGAHPDYRPPFYLVSV